MLSADQFARIAENRAKCSAKRQKVNKLKAEEAAAENYQYREKLNKLSIFQTNRNVWPRNHTARMLYKP